MIAKTKYSGYYVTTDGQVYRDPIPIDYKLDRVGENGLVYLKPSFRGHPKYPQHQYHCVNVSLKDDAGKLIKQIKKSVHQIVAETFIPNPNNLTEIDHINGVKTDNRVENLRWTTRFDNASEPNHKSYTITDTITGKIWEGFNLCEWTRQNYDFINQRMVRKNRSVADIGKDLAAARSKKYKIWNLIVDY